MAGSRRKKSDFPLLRHIDDLMAKLHEHVPVALERFDADAIHDARVATRRLKAAVDLMKPVLTKSHRKPLADGLKRLRRRLGDLRDADVMLDHLGEITSGKHAPAAGWLAERLQHAREKLRDKSRKEPSARRELRRVDRWPAVRKEMDEAKEAVETLLAESLHLQADEFAETAGRLVEDLAQGGQGTGTPHGSLPRYPGAGLGRGPAAEKAENGRIADEAEVDGAEASVDGTRENPLPGPPPAYRGREEEAEHREPKERPRQNPHELRIAGKALRYTLEMAAEEGRSPGVAVMRTFKRLQEQLGNWHDFVVLADRALIEAVDAELMHQDAAAAERLIELAKFAVRRSVQELTAFARLWTQQAPKLVERIRAKFPLSSNPFSGTKKAGGKKASSVGEAGAAVSESETDRGLFGSAETEAPAAAATADSPAA